MPSNAAESARLPASLQPLFDQYVQLTNQALPDFLAGFYLHGSVALGAFNPRLSDLDFITVTSRPCTPNDLAALRTVHQNIARVYPQPPLSGSYLPWGDFGKTTPTSPRPHYHDGTLRLSNRHDTGLVTWHILKTHGLALLGPLPNQLKFDVNWGDLLADMRHNLNTYWVRYTTYLPRLAWLLTDHGVQWTVLGVLRQLYTFRESDITSKTGAGEYALKHLPTQWHKIIQEAISIREGGQRVYRSHLTRAIDARALVKYVIETCNAVG